MSSFGYSFNLPDLWTQAPLVLAVCIPLALLIGQWVRGGLVTVASSGALVATALYWLQLRNAAQEQLYFGGGSFDATQVALTLILAGALLFIAWAVALVDAVQRRRWVWLVVLLLGVYVTVAATRFGFLASGFLMDYVTLFTSPAQPPFGLTTSLPIAVLSIVGTFVGPVATLLYGVTHQARRTRTLPDGLYATPLQVR